MTSRAKRVSGLMNTSVDDSRSSLDSETCPALLCDLLIECHKMKHHSREQVVRRRISKLIKTKINV